MSLSKYSEYSATNRDAAKGMPAAASSLIAITGSSKQNQSVCRFLLKETLEPGGQLDESAKVPNGGSGSAATQVICSVPNGEIDSGERKDFFKEPSLSVECEMPSTLEEVLHLCEDPRATLLGIETTNDSCTDSYDHSNGCFNTDKVVSAPRYVEDTSGKKAAPQNQVQDGSSERNLDVSKKKKNRKINKCLLVCTREYWRFLSWLLDLPPHVKKFLQTTVRAMDGEFTGSSKICRLVITDGLGNLLLNLHIGPHGKVKGTDKEHDKDTWTGPHVAESKWITFDEAKRKAEEVLLVPGVVIVGHSVQSDLKQMKIKVDSKQVRDTAVNGTQPARKLGKAVELMGWTFWTIQEGIHCPYEDCLGALYLYIKLYWEDKYKQWMEHERLQETGTKQKHKAAGRSVELPAAGDPAQRAPADSVIKEDIE